jgi:malate permease and related proteins
MQVVETLAPVFLVIVLGYALTKRAWLHAVFLAEANRVVFWVGLPAFLFISLATAPHGGAQVGRLTLALVVVTLLMIALAYFLAPWLGAGAEARGTFAQAVFRGNIAYVGLPIIAALPTGAEGRVAALLVMAPLLALYNMAGVTLLLSSRHEPGLAMARRVAVEVFKNPLFWSCVAGGAYGWLGGPMPKWVERTFETVGAMSLPLALICIGGTLATTRLEGNRRVATLAAFAKTFVQPALGLLVGRWFGLTAGELQIALIILATPTAAATFTMATQLGGDGPLAAGSVVLSTVYSAVALTAILAAFQI